MAEQIPQADSTQCQRTDDFNSRYANSVRFESSVWDLKMIFGQLDQSGGGKGVIHQHTSITMSWTTVKLLFHYLQVNIFFHESENGRITLPSQVWPPDPRSLGIFPNETEIEPQSKAMLDSLIKMREDFVATLQVSNK